jgi:predicted transcriptional regulator
VWVCVCVGVCNRFGGRVCVEWVESADGRHYMWMAF